MESGDSAQATKLVGIYILNCVLKEFLELGDGLYRNDTIQYI